MKVPKATLLSILQGINCAPRRAGVPASEVVRLGVAKKQLHFALGGDLHAVGSTSVEEDGEWLGYVDRDALMVFVKGLEGTPGADVAVTKVSDAELVMSAGRRKATYSFKSEAVTGYLPLGDIQGEKKVSLSDDMRAWVKRARAMTEIANTHPHLGCVHLSQKYGGIFSSYLGQVCFFVAAKVDRTLNLPLFFAESLGNGYSLHASKEGLRMQDQAQTHFFYHSVIADWARFPAKEFAGFLGKAADTKVLLSMNAGELATLVARFLSYTSSVKGVRSLDVEEGNRKIKGKEQRVLHFKVRTESHARFEEVVPFPSGFKGTVPPMTWNLDALGAFLADASGEVLVRGGDPLHYYTFELPDPKRVLLFALRGPGQQ